MEKKPSLYSRKNIKVGFSVQKLSWRNGPLFAGVGRIFAVLNFVPLRLD